MPVEGREKGVRSPYEVRFGITHPSYLGVNTQKSALSLTDAEGVEGVNLRVKGGRPVCRGGQAKVNVSTIAPIHGFTDTTSDAGLNASADKALSGDGTPYNLMYVIGNQADGTAGVFVHIDRESNVVISTPVESGAIPSAPPVRYGDGDVGAISHDETETEVLTIPGLVSLFELPHVGTSGNCTGLLALGSDLLAAWLDSGAGVKVSLWDGSTLTQDLLVVGGGGGDFKTLYAATLCEFQGTAYLGLAPGLTAVNSLYKRLPGAGSWTTIAYPGATVFRALHGLAYNGRLYVIGEDSGAFVIYSTDGNTLTKERTISVSASSPAVAQLAIVRGVLYYWYHDGTSGASFSKIGKFDGASWLDVEIDLGAQVGALSYTRGLGIVGGHDGANVVFADNSGNLHVWESDGITLSKAWSKVLTNAAGVYGNGSTTPPVRVGPAVS